MANITPRKNKSGQIISYSVRIYNGRNMYGVQNPPKCMTIRRDAKKYPFNERGDAAFEKYAVKFAAEEEIKRKGIPIIDNKQTYEE